MVPVERAALQGGEKFLHETRAGRFRGILCVTFSSCGALPGVTASEHPSPFIKESAVPSSWQTIHLPQTSSGAMRAGILLLLTDGSVLVHHAGAAAGEMGRARQWLRLYPDHKGNYAHPCWSAEIEMQHARERFACGVLADGRVFAIGGQHSDDPVHARDTPLGEIFDAQTNTWSEIYKPSTFQFVRGAASSTVLADGRVLLGGSAGSGGNKRCALWDPRDNSWVEAGVAFGAVRGTTKDDSTAEEGFVLLQNSAALAVEAGQAPRCEMYLPELDRWVSAGCTQGRLVFESLRGVRVGEIGPTVTLPDGRVWAVGATGQTAIYTPHVDSKEPGKWRLGPSFPSDDSGRGHWTTLTAMDAPACVMPSGKVICVGGSAVPREDGYASQGVTLLEYDPQCKAPVLAPLDKQPSLPLHTCTDQCWFLLLPTGQLLVSAHTGELYLYTPDAAAGAPNRAWSPTLISVPSVMVQGRSHTLSGTQFNGMTQACFYGDDGGMATNYPIVRLVNPETNDVVYLRSYGFTTMGIATGTRIPDDLQSCTVDVPANLPKGQWYLTVVANGIASRPATVRVAGQEALMEEGSGIGVGVRV